MPIPSVGFLVWLVAPSLSTICINDGICNSSRPGHMKKSKISPLTLAVRRDDLLNWAVESFVDEPTPQDTQQSSASTIWHTPLSPGRNEDDGTSGFCSAPSAEHVSNQPSGPSVDSTVLNNLKNIQKRSKPGKLQNGKGSGAVQGKGSSADKENCGETNVPQGQIIPCTSLIPFESNALTEQPSGKAPTTLLPKGFRCPGMSCFL